jgi:MYXO-CTERM domain-containing protein
MSRPLALAALVGLASALNATAAQAFCRTSTCDPQVGSCNTDESGCATGGPYLQWWNACVSFGVQKDGSPRRGVDYVEAISLVRNAFVRWQSVSCDGARPSIVFDANSTPVTCPHPEYNQDGGNANAWMFRDEDWPYEGAGSTLALTTVTFNVRTGEIFDADVEINSYTNALAYGEVTAGADLASIVTHEAGHFLGLSHSTNPEATMFATYQKHGSSLTTLHPDDVAGVCATYPPQNARECNFTPRHGFSSECGGEPKEGCSVSVAGAPNGRSVWWLTFAAAALLARRRRG